MDYSLLYGKSYDFFSYKDNALFELNISAYITEDRHRHACGPVRNNTSVTYIEVEWDYLPLDQRFGANLKKLFFCTKFVTSLHFFLLFCTKNAENENFDQLLECAAP